MPFGSGWMVLLGGRLCEKKDVEELLFLPVCGGWLSNPGSDRDLAKKNFRETETGSRRLPPSTDYSEKFVSLWKTDTLYKVCVNSVGLYP